MRKATGAPTNNPETSREPPERPVRDAIRLAPAAPEPTLLSVLGAPTARSRAASQPHRSPSPVARSPARR